MTLFRLKGVPITVGWSWLVIVALIYWSLAAVVFPTSYPDLGVTTRLVMAAVASLLFFASILAHELSHTLQSLREGVAVTEVKLWLFGGVSSAAEPLPGPGAELRVVGAGPAMSAVLAVGFGLVTLGADAVGIGEQVTGVTGWLAWANGVLLAFNVVPALPLDGGRILHAFLWQRSGDRASATLQAAVVGRFFAALLVVVGVLTLLAGSAGGLWLVLIGWFLLTAVEQERMGARLEQAIAGLRVGDLMTTQPEAVTSTMTVADFARWLERRPSHPAYPVLDDAHLRGVLVLDRAGAVPYERRETVRVGEVMMPADEVPTLHADQMLIDAVPVLGRPPGRAVVVDPADPTVVVGVLSVTDLTRALHAGPLRRPSAPPRRSGWTALILLIAGGAVVVAVSAFYHPPVAVIAPGTTFDVASDITVRGVPVQQPTGRYLATAVRVEQPTLLGLAVAVVQGDRELVPLSRVVPTGVDTDVGADYERRLFDESRQEAAVAAARQAGYDASLTGSGARVVAVLPNSPADGVLEVDDTITAVDGTPVATVADLQAALGDRAEGESVTVTVRRGAASSTHRLGLEPLPQLDDRPGIGVLAVTRDLRAVLPFDVTFAPRPEVGGPSAGLAYALALTDLLDSTDDARGRDVAATGVIGGRGGVSDVGGVHQKAVTAESDGADLMLLPADEVDEVGNVDLDVVGVTSLDGAIQALQPTG